MSNLVNALCEIFDVTQHHTSAYHPSTNGMVERQNSTLAQSLRTYCGKEQTKWPELLPSIMMAFRKSPSMHSTEFSPYYLVFGTEMRLPFDVSLEPANHLGRDAKTFIEQCMSNLRTAQKVARENNVFHQEQNKARHDQTARTPDFKVGDLVLFKVTKVPKGLSSKLYDKSDGPYRIIECGPNYTYRIKRCSDNKVNPSLINASNLKHYHDPNTHRDRFEQDNAEPPNNVDDTDDRQHIPPDQIADGNVNDSQTQANDQDGTQTEADPPQKLWKFKNLLRGRFKRGKREIRVEWENGQRTWEPDAAFPADLLEYINKRFTKTGGLRKTCFKRKKFSN